MKRIAGPRGWNCGRRRASGSRNGAHVSWLSSLIGVCRAVSWLICGVAVRRGFSFYSTRDAQGCTHFIEGVSSCKKSERRNQRTWTFAQTACASHFDQHWARRSLTYITSDWDKHVEVMAGHVAKRESVWEIGAPRLYYTSTVIGVQLRPHPGPAIVDANIVAAVADSMPPSAHGLISDHLASRPRR